MTFTPGGELFLTRITRWLPASALTVGLAASCLVMTPAHAQQVQPELDTELLNEQTVWSYLDDGNDPSNGQPSRTAWTETAYEDSDWDTGQGSFGTTESADTQLAQHKADSEDNVETYFFRANFTVDAETLQDNAELTGSLSIDDAAIVYINGERVAEVNVDGLELAEDGEDRNMVYSSAATDAAVEEQLNIPADVLEAGENTIAVQLHQDEDDGSGAYFEMESLSLDGAAEDAANEQSDETPDEAASDEAVDEAAAEDEQDALVSPLALTEGQEWAYLDDGTDPANGLEDRTDWAAPEFDDSDWDTAVGSFGANRGELTQLSGGYLPDNLLDQYYPDTTDNKEAFFFRSDFTVEATDLEDDLILNGSVRYDDAVLIYVNGERVAGFHDDGLNFAEEGDDRNMVFGGSNSGAPILEEFTIPTRLLEEGENTIAVQLHQGRAGSSDIYFDLESLDFVEPPLADETRPWNYLDDGSDPSDGLDNRTDWAAPEFDDADWATSDGGSFGALRGAQEELSGGYYPENLLDQYYPETTNNKEAFFFRTEVDIDDEDLGENTVLRGSIRYDDAAIVYVNGERIDGFHDEDLDFSEEGERRNMVFGGSNTGAPLQGEFIVPNDVLETGENTIAVQLHQGRASSSDIYFGLENLDFDEIEPTDDGQISVMLHMGADPSERRLSWVTDTGVNESVQLAEGAHETMPEDATTIEADEQGDYTEYGREYVHATLADLTAGTYTYRVGSAEGGWSALEQFEVFPQDVEHQFMFMGDPQLGSSGNLARDAEGWQAALDASDQLFPESQFLLSAGDQVENYSGNVDEYRAYIAPQQMRTQASAITLGNHDFNRTTPQSLYGQHYNQPNMADYDTTRGSYWFIYNDVLHLNISTEYRNWDNHREFLETTIEEHGDDVQWTMLTFHRPLYSVANHSTTGTTNEIRDGLGPIINDLDIDVVLTGHDHSYSRSFLIDDEGNQVDPATSEAVVDEDGNVIETPEPTEGDDPNMGYEGTDSSPRLEDGTHVRVTPEENETLFVTANSSSGSKYYNLRNVAEYRDGFQPRFRDQQRVQNITNVEVNQCTVTTNTVELDGTVVDKVELLRDHTAPVITAADTTVTQDDTFDPLADIDVSDDCAVLTTEDVEVDGEVDTSALGDYTLTYSVADAAGNATEFQRVVTVAEATEEPTETPTETPSETPGTGNDDDDTPGTGNGDGDDTPGTGGTGDNGTDQSPGDTPGPTDAPTDTPTPTATDGADPVVADGGDRTSGGLASTGASILTALAIGLAALVLGLVLFAIRRSRQNV